MLGGTVDNISCSLRSIGAVIQQTDGGDRSNALEQFPKVIFGQVVVQIIDPDFTSGTKSPYQ
jgi:hypothetical protein